MNVFYCVNLPLGWGVKSYFVHLVCSFSNQQRIRVLFVIDRLHEPPDTIVLLPVGALLLPFVTPPPLRRRWSYDYGHA